MKRSKSDWAMKKPIMMKETKEIKIKIKEETKTKKKKMPLREIG